MMNLLVSLLVLTAVVWVTIPGGEGMHPRRDSEIQSVPPSPKATSSSVMASSPSSPVSSEKPNWFEKRKQKKKQKEEEKEKAAAAKRKPASGSPVSYYKNVNNVEASSWSQMITSIVTEDCCAKGKENASGYCKTVTGYLDRLNPETRSPDCPRVTNGRCAMVNNEKLCVVDIYTKTKRPICGTGTPFCGCSHIQIEKQLVPFRECVGKLEF